MMNSMTEKRKGTRPPPPMLPIATEKNRKAQSRNAFVRQCCDQQIERLTAEKRLVERVTID